MDVKHLKHIVAVAQYKGIVKAAEAIGISQSALTRSVQSMEKQLGVQLFDRKKNDIKPTPFGQLVINHGENIINEANELSRQLDFMQGVLSGTLRIGSDLLSLDNKVSQSIGLMAQEFPKLKIEIIQDNPMKIIQMLLDGTIDIALTHSSGVFLNKALVAKPLKTYKPIFYCRAEHPVLDKSKIFLHDLQKFPFIFITVTTEIEKLLKDFIPDVFAMRINSETFPNISCDSISAIKAIVLNSDSISWSLDYLVKEDINAGMLAEIPVCDSASKGETPTVFVVKNRTLAPSTEHFLELLF